VATEVLTRILCDVCNHAGAKIEGRRFQLGTYEFDACEEHAAPIVDALKLIEEYGRKIKSANAVIGRPHSPTPSDVECPVCRTPLLSSSLAGHLRGIHGTTKARVEGKPEPHVCPTCGERSQSAQGLGAHMRTHKRARKSAAKAR